VRNFTAESPGQTQRKEAWLRNQERAPRTYELMTVLHPDVPEESLPEELDRISGFISTAGGSIIETLQDSPWGRRRLAYPIRSGGRDVRDGYYTVWHINLGPNRIDELERELKLDVQVIRYLVVSWEPKPVDEKAVEQAEIEAEDAAAEAYAAAQAAAAAVEAADEASAVEPVADEEARQELMVEAESADAATLTTQAEQLEAEGADLAVEAVAAVEDRVELQEETTAALQQSEEASTDADLPSGAIRAGGADCPDEYPVKGNASSRLYHSPGSPSYSRTNPEFCFASAEAAEAAGFKPTKYEAAHDENQ
jgi:small subunit ribosomal protein S6